LTAAGVLPAGKTALAAALAELERAPESVASLALLETAYAAPRGHVLGVTGPPGVGKSTLLSALIPRWRTAGRTVGVIAVDPSSRRSGGALLGDRTRIKTAPGDDGIFIRSMAARDRLGGLAALTWPAMVVMRALFDIVVVETVGVGQSEGDVADLADTVLLCIQPGAGDSLQYMKAGIVEIPDIVAVTKADIGAAAERTRAEARGALSLGEGAAPPVLALSATTGGGLEELMAAVDAHFAELAASNQLFTRRHAQAESWLAATVRERFGRDGLRRAGDLRLAEGGSPFARISAILDALNVD
jgi:LAO/AO transport system kinase